MTLTQRCATFTVGALAGGLLAAAFLPMATAFADEIDLTPSDSTFVPTQVEGYPPLINEVTGTEAFSVHDITTNEDIYGNVAQGVDTQTTIGSFTNDDFLNTGLSVGFIRPGGEFEIPTGTQFDFANFGGGFANEWIDIPAGGTDPGASDLLITPFGDFSLFGSFFTDLSTALG
jgi:hypothetical protein